MKSSNILGRRPLGEWHRQRLARTVAIPVAKSPSYERCASYVELCSFTTTAWSLEARVGRARSGASLARVRTRRQERGERGGARRRRSRGSFLRARGAGASAEQRGAATFDVEESEALAGRAWSAASGALPRNAVSTATLAAGPRSRAVAVRLRSAARCDARARPPARRRGAPRVRYRDPRRKWPRARARRRQFYVAEWRRALGDPTRPQTLHVVRGSIRLLDGRGCYRQESVDPLLPARTCSRHAEFVPSPACPI
jgi:hypothetical protein